MTTTMGPATYTRQDAIDAAHAPAPMDRVMRPHRNKVMVLMVEADSQSGSIIIPNQAKVTTGEAIVVALGAGTWSDEKEEFIPIRDMYVGQRVMVAKYMGSQCILREEIVRDGEVESTEHIYVTLHPDHVLNVYE